MAFTKITAAGIGSTETVTLDGLSVINNGSFGGNLTVGGVLTYEDVTNVDSVGLITARNGIVVGSGITLSKDGDGFFTGVVTATTFSGAFSGDGSALTGVANTDVIFPDKISFGDGDGVNLGLSSDFRIYHDGSNSYIQEIGTGLLYIDSTTLVVRNSAGSEDVAKFVENGAVQLYYDNGQKFATSSSGVTVSGTVAATAVTGDGSALTGIQAGITTSNAATMTGITTVLDLSKDDFKITAAGITTIDVRGGTEGNSHTLRIHNSGITTVGFSTYFLFPSGSSPIIPTADGTISLISFTVHRQGAVGLATQLLAGSSVNFS